MTEKKLHKLRVCVLQQNVICQLSAEKDAALVALKDQIYKPKWDNKRVNELNVTARDKSVTLELAERQHKNMSLGVRKQAEELYEFIRKIRARLAHDVQFHNGGRNLTVKFHDNLVRQQPTSWSYVDVKTVKRGGSLRTTSMGDHRVTLDVEWALELLNTETLNLQSRSTTEGLLLIGLMPEVNGAREAVWVRQARGKQIRSEHGWVAEASTGLRDFLYHSTKSAAAAVRGLATKIKRAGTFSTAPPRKTADKLGAAKKRLRTDKIIRLSDIRKVTGWCLPGCQGFIHRYLPGVTDVAPRATVVAAAELALGKMRASGSDYRVNMTQLLEILKPIS